MNVSQQLYTIQYKQHIQQYHITADKTNFIAEKGGEELKCEHI